MAHFYENSGSGVEARHFVEMTSRPGELRPTRITDVRKMWKEGREVVPSVTTILNVLDKAALVNWKVDQHLRIAHTLSWDETEMMSADEWLAEVKRRTEIEMSKAPDAGTDIHNSLEDWFHGRNVNELHLDICGAVDEAIEQHCGDEIEWASEQRFTDRRGFGGCADLYGYPPDFATHARPWVIDYKTKQTADKFKPGKMAYPDHSRQLAAYREGLGIPNARCANVFICIETGEVDFHEHTEEQLAKGWRVFSHALAIWQEENNYPQATQEAA